MAETNPLNQSNPGTLILSSPTERMYHGGEQIQADPAGRDGGQHANGSGVAQ